MAQSEHRAFGLRQAVIGGLVAASAIAVGTVGLRAADGPAKPVTFSKDVAPIFKAKCQECHQPGSIAPMSLMTFEDSRPWARSIRERVSSHQMPPWAHRQERRHPEVQERHVAQRHPD